MEASSHRVMEGDLDGERNKRWRGDRKGALQVEKFHLGKGQKKKADNGSAERETAIEKEIDERQRAG